VPAATIPPDTWAYQWVATVIRATEQRAGVRSRWNGVLYVEPEHAGSAQEDGSFGASAEILELAAKAYRGEPLSEDELDELQDGVQTLVHETKHLCSWPGNVESADTPPLNAPDVVALEEGLAEDFAQQNVQGVIHDIGLDQVAPGLVDREPDDSSRAYTAATDRLVEGLAELGGTDPAYVRQNLSATGRVDRWHAAAEFLINQRLQGLMPEERRAEVRGELIEAMRSNFAPLKALHDSELDGVSKAIQSDRIGQQTHAALAGTLSRLESQYRGGEGLTQGPEAAEIAHLQRFVGTYTDRDRPGVDDGLGERPDNVRHLQARDKPREVE
jgi:hypothetical protein